MSIVAVGDAVTGEAERLARSTTHALTEVVSTRTRAAGVARASGEWIVVLDDESRPSEALLDALLDAQLASGADVVTCALRVEGTDGSATVRLPLGEPGALGLIENHYGSVALVRRALLGQGAVLTEGKPDPDWPLLASLVLAGARVATVPDPLGVSRKQRGTIRDVPGYGLTVLNLFERTQVPLADLPLLAATLGSAYHALAATSDAAGEAPRSASPLRRILAAGRSEGIAGVVVRALARVRRLPSARG